MEKKKGQISVTVQTSERLAAITYLAEAISDVAKALKVNTTIAISDCHFQVAEGEFGINIDTAEDVTETEIVETD